ncbi:MAG TPA: zf-HC2 domain-containing protein [Vicinamibacteria bacterium]|nr:zf-HC2 domain-containing protein [Vicinamibacteria bacterium]
MDCSEAAPLIEKMVDGEANARERFEAEGHIERCEPCRAYKEFLERVATAARAAPSASPPDSYWDAFPRRVMDRIDADPSRRSIVSSGVMRWAALAATVVVAIAISFYVASQGDLGPAPVELEPPPASETIVSDDTVATAVPSEAEATGETELRQKAAAPPPMARDEAASAPETLAHLDRELEEVDRPSPGSPAEPPADANVKAMEMTAAPQPMLVAEADVGRASRARQARDCEPLRDRLRELVGAGLIEGRYQLALCSLERYQADPSSEFREIAIRDVESFLDVETEGTRASALREALTRIQ